MPVKHLSGADIQGQWQEQQPLSSQREGTSNKDLSFPHPLFAVIWETKSPIGQTQGTATTSLSCEETAFYLFPVRYLDLGITG